MCFFRLTLTESEEGAVHAVEASPLLKGFGHAQGEEDDFRQEVGVGKGELPDCPDLRIVSRGDVAEGFFLAPVAEFHEAGVRDLPRDFEGFSVSGADEPAAGAPGYGDVGGQLDAGLFPADFLQELRHFLRLRGGFTEDVFRFIEEFRVFPELPGEGMNGACLVVEDGKPVSPLIHPVEAPSQSEGPAADGDGRLEVRFQPDGAGVIRLSVQVIPEPASR